MNILENIKNFLMIHHPESSKLILVEYHESQDPISKLEPKIKQNIATREKSEMCPNLYRLQITHRKSLLMSTHNIIIGIKESCISQKFYNNVQDDMSLQVNLYSTKK